MAKNIESYNSSYPLAYYEIGNVYAFYGFKKAKGKPASEELIKQFSSVLWDLELYEESDVIKPVKSEKMVTKSSHLNRFYAVVVGKEDNKIIVMFRNVDNGHVSFLTRAYAVSYGCETDGKDLMPTSLSTNISGIRGNVSKIGGITYARNADEERKVGGITKTGNRNSSAIGRITKIKKDYSKKIESVIIQTQTDRKLGDATRSSRVGGITRVKNN